MVQMAFPVSMAIILHMFSEISLENFVNFSRPLFLSRESSFALRATYSASIALNLLCRLCSSMSLLFFSLLVLAWFEVVLVSETTNFVLS